MNTSTRLLAATACILLASTARAADSEFQVRIQVDFQQDVGQNFGSLFEAHDAQGEIVAGAGYVGSYNTQSRSDRRNLHFFVRSKAASDFNLHPLPRPTTDAGTYLFDFDNRVYSQGRGGEDNHLRAWDTKAGRWVQDRGTTPFSVSVGHGVLTSDSQGAYYNGQPILLLSPDQGTLAERYYANGRLVFRRHDAAADPPINELVACPWTTETGDPVSLEVGHRIAMRTAREFVYAFGQINGQVVAATNTGGVYSYDGQTWKTVLEPDINVSFQIYAMINYRDRLLMGQYPTGELFAYDGETFEHIPGWPPVMPGVSRKAREAQTLTIYGGDLFCGVWPWGEIWKYRSENDGWQFAARAFTHPEPTDATIHPYENETKQLGEVLNRWGQRITSLVPLGDSLFVSTSSKGGNRYEPKFDFMSREQANEYGAVYRVHRPGALVVPTRWKDGPTDFEFRIEGGKMTVLQDGQVLGTTDAPAELATSLADAKLTWGQGIYGPLRGKIIAKTDREPSTASGRKEVFAGAYIDMHHCFDRQGDQKAARQSIEAHLRRFQSLGLNTIIPKCTTSSGRANYPSQFIAEHTYADWDPLAHFIGQARQLDLAVWPTVCMMVCGHDQPSGILKSHPEWAMRSPTGEPIGYISPGHPAARKWLVAMLEEIVGKYQPDGLILDYLRYHNRPIQLDAYSAALFEKELELVGQLDENQRAEKLQNFREQLLTELMAEIHTALRKVKPDLKLAIYSWGPHVIENHRVAQDWQTWVDRGYLDMINISGYLYPEQNGEDYLTQLEEKLRLSKSIVAGAGRSIPVTFALGVRTSHGEVQSAAQIGKILQAARRADVDGVAFFTWSYLQPWVEGVEKSGSLMRFIAGE
ncbi:MAG: family 10 glycosylhydrolase [Planctomycetales bacterium]|nr:family 10 glycosylhydrolase [Planctomycetales bacterium]